VYTSTLAALTVLTVVVVVHPVQSTNRHQSRHSSLQSRLSHLHSSLFNLLSTPVDEKTMSKYYWTPKSDLGIDEFLKKVR
jgi:hypothetical protein